MSCFYMYGWFYLPCMYVYVQYVYSDQGGQKKEQVPWCWTSQGLGTRPSVTF